MDPETQIEEQVIYWDDEPRTHVQRVGTWAREGREPSGSYSGQLEFNPAGSQISAVSADQASVSLLRGAGAGVLVHPLLPITSGGCSSRERASGRRVPAAGSPESSEGVRPARGQGPGVGGAGSAASL